MKWTIRVRAVSGLAVGFLQACGGAPAPETPSAQCVEPAGAPAQPFEPPNSVLGVTVNVSQHRLARELAAQVPEVLARAKRRNVGAPGKLSYVIRRGEIDVDVENQQLQVRTPLRGEIEVCKPLGPVCVRYGTCQPRWEARVTLPLTWAEPLQAQTNVSLTNQCVLKPVGYNATPHVEEVTAKESRKVATRINRELHRAQQRLLRDLERELSPIEVPPGELCLQWQPSAIEYDLTAESNEQRQTLKFAGQTSGQVSTQCSASGEELPVPQLRPGLEPQIDISVPLTMDLEQVQLQLSQNAPGPVELRAFQSLGGGSNTLHVGVPGYDACGKAWMLATPQLKPDGLQLSTSAKGPAADWLNAQRVPFPAAKKQLETALTKLQNKLETDSKKLGREQRFDAGINSEYQPEVHVSSTQLVLLLRLRGSAKALVY